MRRSKIVAILAPVVILAAFAGIALGVYQLVIPNQVDVLPGDEVVTAWYDSDATISMDLIDWGEIVKGTSLFQDVYVRNDGTVPVTVTIVPIGMPTGLTLTQTPSSNLIPVDGIAMFTLELAAGPSAATGAEVMFDFRIDSNQ